MALQMKKVGPSARAKDAPLRQDLRLQFAPALEALQIGEEGIQIALPDGIEVVRFRSLLNAVSNRAGYRVSTEVVFKTKKGQLVMEPDADGKPAKVPVAVNVYKIGDFETAAAEPETEPEDEAPAPRKATKVVVPPVEPETETDDEDFDPLGGDDEDDD